MRKMFIECKSRGVAQRKAPWAAIISKVEGGYMVFESIDDWQVWRRQK